MHKKEEKNKLRNEKYTSNEIMDSIPSLKMKLMNNTSMLTAVVCSHSNDFHGKTK